ncbi:ATP-binding protein [Breznakia pachnodae]|uniref:Schlafen AlbA-2 domain-containing protein n=1 Tax=Breznakia pachnodae TaxID=265178 RepID=A0ABU0E4U3_9FIRM|nr:ATP-binding protein [Breznakia pachnodae]MDQ0361520.1 hypothetical protein [Breznakia pachnodae]
MDKIQLNNLISSKTDENEWLDYKREWHANKIELLRDILAFANTTHHRDCYLVFGVEDNTFEIFGVNEDTNRRNTQQITDMLIHQPFSGEAPKIQINTVVIDDKIIDILTVFNTLNVPLFLTKNSNEVQGKRIHLGQIITRISDTNTSSNSSASDSIVEKLYRKRMRLDQTIYERYQYLMEHVNDWTYIDWEQKLLYNFDPNFYILIEPLDSDDERDRIHTGDYYGWLANSSSFPSEWRIQKYSNISAMYGQHKILDFSFLFNFDRDRGLTIAPRLGGFGTNRDLKYSYFTKDSLDWKFMLLYISAWNNHMIEGFDSAYYSSRTILSNVVVYEDEEERKYIEDNYRYNMTIEDLENDFNVRIEPTKEEIEKLQQENPKFGRSSLLQINIAKAIKKRLNDIKGT